MLVRTNKLYLPRMLTVRRGRAVLMSRLRALFSSASQVLPPRSDLCPTVVAMFRVPGFMDEPEVLSRGSCFQVAVDDDNDGGGGRRPRWICSRHVVQPQLHTQDYFNTNRSSDGERGDLSWLNEVRAEHITLHVEWQQNGAQRPVDGLRVHPDLDVCELLLLSQPPSAKVIRLAGRHDLPLQPDEELLFYGHNLTTVEEEDNDPDTTLGTMIPHAEVGRVRLVSPMRAVAETDRPLQMGMCGGAVVRRCNADGNEMVAVGMTEGILPTASPSSVGVQKAFPDHAVILSSEVLREWLLKNK